MFPLIVNVFITFLKWNSTLLTNIQLFERVHRTFSTPGDQNHVSAEHGKGRPMVAETLLSKQTQIPSFSC